MKNLIFSALAAVVLSASPGLSQVRQLMSGTEDAQQSEEDILADALDAFLAVFYHELGHALIDILQPPVLGHEEDAADILSVVLINELWEPEESAYKLRAAAGYWAQTAAHWAETGAAPYYGGVHSPDERRYYTYVCLYYGADPEERTELAIDLGLPADRAVSCPQEYALASESWGPYLDEIYEAGAGTSLRWTGPEGADDPFALMLRDEIDYLNSILTLPTPLSIEIALCDQPNAFYDLSSQSITMCWELAEWMMGLRPNM